MVENSKQMETQTLQSSSKSPQWTYLSELKEKYDSFILDCDGVIWQANKEIDESIKVIEHLEAIGKKVFFFTNNSTKLAEDLINKLKSFGYKNPKSD